MILEIEPLPRFWYWLNLEVLCAEADFYFDAGPPEGGTPNN
jgi:hypothetical protein